MRHQHSVLLVEDDAAIRNALAGLLSDKGVRAQGARDGREAMRKLESRRRPPCLVLLDLMMPGMNGWEFLELHRSRESLASIPLILVTAWVETDVAQARAMIAKPIDAPRLLRTVRRILREEEKRKLARPVARIRRTRRRVARASSPSAAAR
jgi:CheY-like chemotaxis protein